ncbi:MAG: hypothetical protein M3Q08_14775 [Pseudomonadota bacterium]|nr:hypothetical protein [Pseudomonadota bacterium]
MKLKTIGAGRPKLTLAFGSEHGSAQPRPPRPLNRSGDELRRIVAERIG